MLKLDSVTGKQTLTDTLTDAARTGQLKCYLKWISAFHTWKYVFAVKYYRIIVPTFVYLLGIWFPFRVIANISLLQIFFTIYLLLKFSIIISGCQNMSRNFTINIHNPRVFV